MKESGEKQVNKNKLSKALIKKALGYEALEVVEEYVSSDEGEVKLLKKKVTKKNVPPDMTALKYLLESQDKPIEQMTDEQLEAEKERLLKILEDEQKQNKIKENKIAGKK